MQSSADCCMCRYLTGNPCTEYEGYQQYVIATLLRLQVCSVVIYLLVIATVLLYSRSHGNCNNFITD